MMEKKHKMGDPPEKIYYEDKKIRVTESYVTIFKRAIIPLEKIQMVEVDHRVYGLYTAFTASLMSFITLYYFSPHIFVLVFGVCCIWVRYEYEHYVELIVRADNGVKAKIAILSLSKRNDIYRMSDAIENALCDRKAKTETQVLSITETMKLRRFLGQLDDAHLEKSEENMRMMTTVDEKIIKERN